MVDPVYKHQEKIRLVAWPSPQDYNEAIQNPQLCFEDRELANLAPQLNALGLPKPATGNFATVYHLSGNDSEFAVRCFLNPLKDEQHRYAALASCLKKLNLPFCVRFEFIDIGIRVHGDWRPLVKMEWANGTSLAEHVRSIRTKPEELNKLAENFKQMVLRLSESGIAHGDLQHGNIIVDGDRIKLVDYDGVFVPELEGFGSNELGHPNYQHPQRTADFFNGKLDHFSAWVIYASLRILAIDPTLWQMLNGGDECLLFRHADYIDPAGSQAFYILETHPDPQVRLWSRQIRWLLSQPIEDLPALDAPPMASVNLPPVREPVVSFDQQKDLFTGVPPPEPAVVSVEEPVPVRGVTTGAPVQTRQFVTLSIAAALVLLPVLIAILSSIPKLMADHANVLEQQQHVAPSTINRAAEDAAGDAALVSTANPTRAQSAYLKALKASDEDLDALAADYYKAALTANEIDHSLTERQFGNCWHMIGHWQYRHDEGDSGLSAFRKAYAAYDKSGIKYTNMLDDIARVLNNKRSYFESTDTSFAALKAGLSGAGRDGDVGYFSSYHELESIGSQMPELLKQDPKRACLAFGKIVDYLLPSATDNAEVRSHKTDALNMFTKSIADEAWNQLHMGNLDTAKKLTDLLGRCIGNAHNGYEQIYKDLMRQISDRIKTPPTSAD